MSKCEITDPSIICVAGTRYRRADGYRQVSAMPLNPAPADLDGLIYVGHCVCCVKASPVGARLVNPERLEQWVDFPEHQQND